LGNTCIQRRRSWTKRQLSELSNNSKSKRWLRCKRCIH